MCSLLYLKPEAVDVAVRPGRPGMKQERAALDAPGVLLTYPSPGVAHLSICSEPANALNLSLWTSLTAALRHAEGDGQTMALVISSGLARPVFSAGNDLTELHAPSTSASRFTRFWTTQTRFLAALYASSLRTVAALRGACPAGGCAIALCCDERVALRGRAFAIGLNEAALGIPVPRYWARLMVAVGGRSRAAVERMLYTGAMAGADRALELGLVDRVVDGDAADLEAAAVAAAAVAAAGAAKVGGVRAVGFRETKLAVRGEFSAEWSAYAEEEAAQSWELLRGEDVSRQLGRVLARLGGKKKARL